MMKCLITHQLSAAFLLQFAVWELCMGVGTLTGDNYIIGGNEVRPPGLYGWQGFLTIDGFFRCGAILVSQNAVLTSASCVDNLDPSRASVTLGLHDKDSRLEGQPDTYGVVDIQIYPFYNASLGFPGNIAIAELDENVDETNVYITEIPLPASGREPSDWLGLDCYATGWGPTTPGSGSTPNFLQEVLLPVITTEDCAQAWEEAGYPETLVNEASLCGFNGLASTCGADDGGPYVCEVSERVFELVGMTSWRDSGCSPEFPSVFTMLSYPDYNEWIVDHLPTP